MKKYVQHIKIVMIVLLVIVSFSFANYRNDKRTVNNETKIEFLNEESLYITHYAVNNLLIQNKDTASKVLRESLDLNETEKLLNEHDMIKDAEVYLTVSGTLGARIVQRTPIARVAGKEHYYVDDEGRWMPLSPVYAARVPLVTGQVQKDKIQRVFYLADFIYHDDFLKKNVIGIHKDKDGFKLRFRTDDFVLRLSNLERLDKKFNNFKAFYQKATKDKSLATYKAVDLDFDNQVVCTKK